MYEFFFGNIGVLRLDSRASIFIWLILTVGGSFVTFIRDKERKGGKRFWHSLSTGIMPGAVYIGIVSLIYFFR